MSARARTAAEKPPTLVVPLVSALLAFVSYAILGIAVSGRPPGAFDRDVGAAAFGAATPLAAALTACGRFPAYFTACVAVFAAGLFRRAILPYSLASIALLLIALETSDTLKNVFRRPRPVHWLVTREPSWSYSSGHATLSLAFYGFWALVVLRSSLPRGVRLALASALVLWSVAIAWSRLALGAHFATDVLGGYALAVGLLSLAYLAVRQLERRSEAFRLAAADARAAAARRRGR